MLQVTALPTGHADLVADVAYDYYGERLATASADQRIKIWRKDEAGKWQEEADWRAHDAPVTRLAWSHPEHGDLLASCSFDRSVKVWQEASDTRQGSGSGSSSTRWTEKAFLSEAKGSVRAVEFAPNHFGLKLASISTDAQVRLYASLSPTGTDWQMGAAVHLPSLAGPDGADGRDDGRAAQGGGGGGSAFGTPASTLGGGSGATLQTHASGAGSGVGSAGSGAGSAGSGGPGKNNEALGGWDLSFCKEHWWGLLVAVACGTWGTVTIVDLAAEPPVAVLALNPAQHGAAQTTSLARESSQHGAAASASSGPGSGAAPITTLAWAPSCGRSYHLVATGSLDGTVRVWRVTPPDAFAGEGGEDGSAMDEGRSWAAEVSAEWGRGDAGVAKVEWNITGTVLSVATEDGRIRLYKMAYGGSWDCMGTFSAEAPAEGSDGADADGDDGMRRE